MKEDFSVNLLTVIFTEPDDGAYIQVFNQVVWPRKGDFVKVSDWLEGYVSEVNWSYVDGKQPTVTIELRPAEATPAGEADGR